LSVSRKQALAACCTAHVVQDGLLATLYVLLPVLGGEELGETLARACGQGNNPMFNHDFAGWEKLDDLEVIGRKVSTICCIEGLW